LSVEPLFHVHYAFKSGSHNETRYLVDANNLAIDFLDLLQLAQEVPETGFGNDLVRGKEAHAEELWAGLLLGRKVAADNLVLVKLLISNRFNE